MYDFEGMVAAVPKKRLAHTTGVRDTALMLARRHYPWLDENDITAAALLHDITKYLSREEHLRLCRDYDIKLDEDEMNSPRVLHQITGAEVAKRRFGVSDAVYNAIRCHTTGRRNMEPLDLVILFADYIEPNRKYEGCEEIRAHYEQLFSNGAPLPLEQAVSKALGMTIIEVANRGEVMHPDIVEARNSLIIKIENSKKEMI